MKKFAIAIVFLILGILVVPVCAWVYLNFGHPPVAVADAPFPAEEAIVEQPLHKRIEAEMPTTSPVPVNETTLTEGATVYMKQCAFCHGAPGAASSAGKNMYPDAPPLWVSHHGGATIGVSDDPAGETYWKVKNGIRLTGMPAYNKVLTDTEMWEVSNLLAIADKPMPDAVKQVLAQPQTLSQPQTTPTK